MKKKGTQNRGRVVVVEIQYAWIMRVACSSLSVDLTKYKPVCSAGDPSTQTQHGRSSRGQSEIIKHTG